MHPKAIEFNEATGAYLELLERVPDSTTDVAESGMDALRLVEASLPIAEFSTKDTELVLRSMSLAIMGSAVFHTHRLYKRLGVKNLAVRNPINEVQV